MSSQHHQPSTTDRPTFERPQETQTDLAPASPETCATRAPELGE